VILDGMSRSVMTQELGPTALEEISMDDGTYGRKRASRRMTVGVYLQRATTEQPR